MRLIAPGNVCDRGRAHRRPHRGAVCAPYCGSLRLIADLCGSLRLTSSGTVCVRRRERRRPDRHAAPYCGLLRRAYCAGLIASASRPSLGMGVPDGGGRAGAAPHARFPTLTAAYCGLLRLIAAYAFGHRDMECGLLRLVAACCSLLRLMLPGKQAHGHARAHERTCGHAIARTTATRTRTRARLFLTCAAYCGLLRLIAAGADPRLPDAGGLHLPLREPGGVLRQLRIIIAIYCGLLRLIAPSARRRDCGPVGDGVEASSGAWVCSLSVLGQCLLRLIAAYCGLMRIIYMGKARCERKLRLIAPGVCRLFCRDLRRVAACCGALRLIAGPAAGSCS